MWLSPEVIEQDALFKRTVADLSRPEVDAGAALTAAKSSADFEAAIGFAALAARAEIPPGQTSWTVRTLSHCSEELEPYIFAALESQASYPVIGPALTQLDEGIDWEEPRSVHPQAAGSRRDRHVETFRRNVRWASRNGRSFIEAWKDELGSEFCDAFEEWRRGTIDIDFVRQFARIWERPFDTPPTLLVGRRRELVEIHRETHCEQVPRRSVLLVGEQGVGKSAIVRAALDRLPPSSLVLEATAAPCRPGRLTSASSRRG